jgi:hypothetical protein
LNDVCTQINAFITNENGWARNQFLDFMLTFAAERAIQNFICGICSFYIAQDGSLVSDDN